jgi:hypothetical protein
MFIKSTLLFLLVVHGLIHLLGFAKGLNPAALPAITRPISRFEGALWLLCALLLLATALLLGRFEAWWIVGLAGILLSQGLLFRHWSDARFGTALNAVLLLAVALGYARWAFDREVQLAVASIQTSAASPQTIVDESSLAPLPSPVQRWLRRASVLGKPIVANAHLRQKGRMRTAPDGAWMPVQAEQWIAVSSPAFVWSAQMYPVPGLHIAGRDTLREGRGRMLIKVLSSYTIADAAGPQIDQGALVRFLAEIVWVPSAALADTIRWSPIDENRATATLGQGGTSVSATFEFSPEGDPRTIRADRYYTREQGATLEKWRIGIDQDSFQVIDGLRIPMKSTVTWELAEGDFEWFQVEIGDLEFDHAGIAAES